MNRLMKSLLSSICLFVMIHAGTAAMITTNDYLKFHSDIKVAIEELDVKKAKSLVKSLLPILESDIEYTEELIADEDDEYFLGKLNSNLKRQKEIKQELQAFLKLSKSKAFDDSYSINMVRELRRLSFKPKER